MNLNEGESRTYEVVYTVHRDEDDDQLYEREAWFLDGRLHREGDLPAITDRRIPDGLVRERRWYTNGELNREAKPAIIFENGSVTRHEFYREGTRFRDSGPQEIEVCNYSGYATVEIYATDGKIARVGGPSEIYREEESGNLISEEWNHPVFGRHRVGGPASIDCDPGTGTITHERWFKNNMHHRPVQEGPALTVRDARTGEVVSTHFFENGVELSPPWPPQSTPTPS